MICNGDRLLDARLVPDIELTLDDVATLLSARGRLRSKSTVNNWTQTGVFPRGRVRGSRGADRDAERCKLRRTSLVGQTVYRAADVLAFFASTEGVEDYATLEAGDAHVLERFRRMLRDRLGIEPGVARVGDDAIGTYEAPSNGNGLARAG